MTNVGALGCKIEQLKDDMNVIIGELENIEKSTAKSDKKKRLLQTK